MKKEYIKPEMKLVELRSKEEIGSSPLHSDTTARGCWAIWGYWFSPKGSN